MIMSVLRLTALPDLHVLDLRTQRSAANWYSSLWSTREYDERLSWTTSDASVAFSIITESVSGVCIGLLALRTPKRRLILLGLASWLV
jgi:hypothetical protein